MRVHAPLDDVISGRTSVRVLRTLSLFPEKEFTGRQLATMSGAPPSKVIQELERLREQGLVTRQTYGRTHAWRVNRDHALFRLLAPAFELEHKLPEEFLAELARGVDDERITRAALFGSYARGEETARSDVDLLVIVKRASELESIRNRLDDLSIGMSKKYGAHLSPIVHAESDLPRLKKTQLAQSIREEARYLRGEPI